MTASIAPRGPDIPQSEREPESGVLRASERAPDSGVRRREDFGSAGRIELGVLEQAAAEAAALAEAQPTPEHAQDARIAANEVKLFLKEHDNAGAFKFSRFGREMVSMFEPDEDGARRIEHDPETGAFTLTESEKNRRVLFVQMGELARLNKEGGHKGGNDALRSTVHVIEAALQLRLQGKEGRAAGYTIVRSGSNEFMISLDDASQMDAAEIARDIAAIRPKLPGREDVESWPLTVDGFALQEALDIVNQSQLELGPGEQIDPGNAGRAARETIEVMRRYAGYLGDTQKFPSRVERVREKLAESPEAGKAFYDAYMKKTFGDRTPEQVVAMTADEVRAAALEFAASALPEARRFADARDAVVAARVAEIRASQGPAEKPTLDDGTKLAKIPDELRGMRHFHEKEAAVAAADASGTARDRREARQHLSIERAERDSATGMRLRGELYATLQAEFLKPKEQRSETSLVFYDLGALGYFDSKGGRDVGDAAIKLTAAMMEKSAGEDAGAPESFRYAGDELITVVHGGIDAAAAFDAQMRENVRDAGAVPPGRRGTSGGYRPTGLLLDRGISDMTTAERIFDDLAAQGHFAAEDLADPEFVANQKTELMVIAADKAIEATKATNRFLLFVEAKRDARYAADPNRRQQVDDLVTASGKALLADSGGSEFLERLVASGLQGPELTAEVQRWVGENGTAAKERETRHRDLVDQLVEMHGKIRFYERELDKATHETAEAKAAKAKLEEQLVIALAEKAKLLDVRKALE